MKKIAIYARISTTDKNQDLDTQLIPLQEYVKNRGWEVFRSYTDTDSGSKENRPALTELLNDAHKRKFDCVVVFRFDRFSRSTKQLITSLDTFNSLGIDFVSYQEAIDTSTPTGKVMFTMISAFAEFERSIIQERVRAGMAKARAKGKKIGRPASEIDIVRISELRQQGLSVRRIASMVNISKSTVQNAISSFK
ncbi:recombinase family protein [Candidatus Microgenomates bacterium]|nr:recombinase family protein [Candidatus Microgenomates bacterium]